MHIHLTTALTMATQENKKKRSCPAKQCKDKATGYANRQQWPYPDNCWTDRVKTPFTNEALKKKQANLHENSFGHGKNNLGYHLALETTDQEVVFVRKQVFCKQLTLDNTPSAILSLAPTSLEQPWSDFLDQLSHIFWILSEELELGLFR